MISLLPQRNLLNLARLLRNCRRKSNPAAERRFYTVVNSRQHRASRAGIPLSLRACCQHLLHLTLAGMLAQR